MSETSPWNVINPADESVFLTVEPTSEKDIDAILARMRAAQQAWRNVPVEERVKVCREFVGAFRSIKDKVALDITRQMGKPLIQARAKWTPCSTAPRPCCAWRPPPCRTTCCRPRKASAATYAASRSASCSTFRPGTIRC